MWQTIGLVTTGFTLVAFLAACLASALNRRSRERDEEYTKRIKSIPPSERAEVLIELGDRVHVDVKDLPDDHRKSVLLKELENRGERTRLREKTIVTVAVIFGILTLTLISLTILARVQESRAKAEWDALNRTTTRKLDTGRDELNRVEKTLTTPEQKSEMQVFRDGYEVRARDLQNSIEERNPAAYRDELKGMGKWIQDLRWEPIFPKGFQDELYDRSCGDPEQLRKQMEERERHSA